MELAEPLSKGFQQEVVLQAKALLEVLPVLKVSKQKSSGWRIYP